MAQFRTCPRCRKELPLGRFAFRDKARTKPQSYCRDCQNAAWQDWYSRPDNAQHHRDLVRSRRRRRIDRHQALIRLSKDVPCADCGERYPPYVMDFDHVGDKTAAISQMMSSVGTMRLLEEIRKCEVVCANCHRERTHRRATAQLASD